MLLPQFIRQAASSLEALYPPREARSLAERLAEDIQGVKPYAWVIDPALEASDALQDGLRRLLDGEPLQYVTGFQEFYGRRFAVRPGVLIPRPETEILVREACVRALQMDSPRVLDLCTGSGCIAWSIALEVPGAEVTAVDLSDAALDVARAQNPCDSHPEDGSGAVPGAKRRASAPLFVKADILLPQEFPGGPFDIIVSNPPYIRESEKSAMNRNVLEHEPAMALFVPDSDPLVFYRAVAGACIRQLVPGGWGMVEINESLGEATAEAFAGAGLRNVRIMADFFGKDRFVIFNR